MSKTIKKQSWNDLQTNDGRDLIILKQGLFSNGDAYLGYIVEPDGTFMPTSWKIDGTAAHAIDSIKLVSTTVNATIFVYKTLDGYLAKCFQAGQNVSDAIRDNMVTSQTISWEE